MNFQPSVIHATPALTTPQFNTTTTVKTQIFDSLGYGINHDNSPILTGEFSSPIPYDPLRVLETPLPVCYPAPPIVEKKPEILNLCFLMSFSFSFKNPVYVIFVIISLLCRIKHFDPQNCNFLTIFRDCSESYKRYKTLDIFLDLECMIFQLMQIPDAEKIESFLRGFDSICSDMMLLEFESFKPISDKHVFSKTRNKLNKLNFIIIIIYFIAERHGRNKSINDFLIKNFTLSTNFTSIYKGLIRSRKFGSNRSKQ